MRRRQQQRGAHTEGTRERAARGGSGASVEGEDGDGRGRGKGGGGQARRGEEGRSVSPSSGKKKRGKMHKVKKLLPRTPSMLFNPSPVSTPTSLSASASASASGSASLRRQHPSAPVLENLSHLPPPPPKPFQASTPPIPGSYPKPKPILRASSYVSLSSAMALGESSMESSSAAMAAAARGAAAARTANGGVGTLTSRVAMATGMSIDTADEEGLTLDLADEGEAEEGQWMGRLSLKDDEDGGGRSGSLVKKAVVNIEAVREGDDGAFETESVASSSYHIGSIQEATESEWSVPLVEHYPLAAADDVGGGVDIASIRGAESERSEKSFASVASLERLGPPRRSVRFQRMYACKTVLTANVKKGYMDQLLNEIRVMRTLDHPYILQLFEVYQVKREFSFGARRAFG